MGIIFHHKHVFTYVAGSINNGMTQILEVPTHLPPQIFYSLYSFSISTELVCLCVVL